MARLFFVAYGGGHVAMLLPVARAALQAGHELLFLGLTTARNVLAQAGIPVIGFSDLRDFAAPNAARYGRELAMELPAGGPVAKEESEAYLGISFADLAATSGEVVARTEYEARGRHAFLPVAFLERVLHYHRPDLVVATNSPRAEQAAILAAGHLGIPSVCAVDLFALQEVRWIGQSGYANRVCVLNEAVRSMFLEHGRLMKEVVVTGNPAFDGLMDPQAILAGAVLRQRRGWNDGRINVLWASQAEPQRHPFDGRPGDPLLPRRVEQVLRELIARMPGMRLVVRYHPNEQVHFVPQERVELSTSEEVLAPLLHAVDLVVVTASTVGLEASLAGRPVVSVDCTVFTADAPYSEMDISTGVTSPDQLSTLLPQLMDAGLTPGLHGGASAGHATDRILEVIENLLTHGS